MHVTSNGKLIFTADEKVTLKAALNGNTEAVDSLKRLLAEPGDFDA